MYRPDSAPPGFVDEATRFQTGTKRLGLQVEALKSQFKENARPRDSSGEVARARSSQVATLPVEANELFALRARVAALVQENHGLRAIESSLLKRVEKFESDLEVARRDRLARHDLEVEMRAQFETELDAALQEAAAKIKQLRGERGEARSALDETAARLEEFKAQAAAREASSGNENPGREGGGRGSPAASGAELVSRGRPTEGA